MIAIPITAAFTIDPFNIWHVASADRYLTSDPRIAKFAIARSSQFDSFIVGTSLSEEFNVPRLGSSLGASWGDLTMGGATSYEMVNVVKSLPRSDYRYLVLEVYFASYKGEEKETRDSDYPSYLWDDGTANDVLVYFDTLRKKQLLAESLRAIEVNVLGQEREGKGLLDQVILPNGVTVRTRVWNQVNAVSGTEKVYELTDRSGMSFHRANLPEMLEVASEKFEKIIVYLPPISAVSLRQQLLATDPTNFARYQEWTRWAKNLASEYGDVSLIDYQSVSEITTNGYNYWDYNHYRENVSEMLTDDFIAVLKDDSLAHGGFGDMSSYEGRVSIQELQDFDPGNFIE